MQLTVYAGGTMVLERNFDPDRILELVERHGVSVMTTVPVVWERMARSPEFADRDLSTLTSAAVGGAPVPLDLLELYRQRGVSLIQVYGLTEASGLVSALRVEDAPAHPRSAGQAIMGTTVRIGTDQDGPAEPGHVGEVLVRGANVMKEYWEQPEATAATIRDGWLCSGDLGVMDADGFITIVDRTKDMLISGGINVYPAEIERALAGVPGVVDLAVIGIRDQEWGQVPLLLLHTDGDPATPLQAIGAVAQRELAGFKRPRFAVVCERPLPRTLSGKISKPELRQRYPVLPDGAVPL
jgi:acyl-CoA synthetase (AMP-forming)/AMP-acid ligase II